MNPNLRHRRADFKTNPVTENDAGPHHLAGTRCKSHCAVSSRTIWQTNHQLDFNEKSGKWFIFFCVSCQIFFFKLAHKCCALGMDRDRAARRLCSGAAWISNRGLKGKNLQLRCLHVCLHQWQQKWLGNKWVFKRGFCPDELFPTIFLWRQMAPSV